MRIRTALAAVVCAGLATVGLTVPAAAAQDKTWLLVADRGALPAGLAKKVERAGGTLTASYPFGVATVTAPAAFPGVPGTTAVVDQGFSMEDTGATGATPSGATRASASALGRR